MPEAPPLTRELALALERTIAPGPDGLEPAWTRAVFGQTVAIRARTGRPFNKVFCFGHDDLAHLPAILDFYAAESLHPTFYLAPARFTSEVASALSAAGLVARDLCQAILYGLPDPAPALLPPELTIEPVRAGNLEDFVQTTAAGFEWPDAWREAAKAGVRTSFRDDGLQFLARWQGTAAGVAGLSRADGMIGLTGGAVRPEFRGRGIHSALVKHRLHWIHQQKAAPLVTGGADYLSTSFRNQQRAGLRLAYVECAWTKI